MKVFKSEAFWILAVFMLLTGLLWMKTDRYYNKKLKNTKHQIYKKDALRKK